MMTRDRYTRQGFLGHNAEELLGSVRIGIVGLGGGGSHIVQQLAHVGVQNFVLYDPDTVEASNLNRLIAGTDFDARSAALKIDVAQRQIVGILPAANVEALSKRWQEEPSLLRSCDIIVGCVDSLADRRELEVAARRFLIPYVDIGLGVVATPPDRPRMAGQVVLSMPGALCFTCLGLLNDRDLAAEAARYGDAGPRPQVVWGNGVLASLAVGVIVDLVTDWTASLRSPVYLSYDGNTGLVQPHPRLQYLPSTSCPHFGPKDIGEPKLTPL